MRPFATMRIEDEWTEFFTPHVPNNIADFCEYRGGTNAERRARHVDHIADPTTGHQFVSGDQALTVAILRTLLERREGEAAA